MVYMETMGDRIRQERTRLKLSQEQLGDVAGISKQAVSKIESGLTKNPELANFYALADLFRVNPRWLALGEPHVRETAESQVLELDRETILAALTLASESVGITTGDRFDIAEDPEIFARSLSATLARKLQPPGGKDRGPEPRDGETGRAGRTPRTKKAREKGKAEGRRSGEPGEGSSESERNN
jgi:transcriptional regulator with XRE-family HTH domain